MKQFLLLPALCLFLLSCSKESTKQPETTETKLPKNAINFNVSGFTQSTGPVTTTIGNKSTNVVKPITEVVNHLYYLIYDSRGNQINRLEQHTNSAGTTFKVSGRVRKPTINTPYGSFTDSLQAGSYTVAVAGAVGELSFNSVTDAADGYPAEVLDSARCYPYQKTVTDMFFYKGTLQVGSANQTQSIDLKRLVGQLELQIEDAIPANADQIYCYVGYDMPSVRIATGRPAFEWYVNSSPISYQFTTADKGKTGITKAGIVLNTELPMVVEIACFDAYNHLIAKKSITGVKVNANEKTTLRGKLFDAKQGANFSINLNQNWDLNSTTIHF